MLRSLGRLLDVPGVYVWGSNDYYGPTLKNPLRYLTERGKPRRPGGHKLPWEDLGRAFSDRGWVDLTHERAVLEIRGIRFGFRGTDDAHLGLDHYASVAGPIDRSALDVAIGVTHAPYRRVLEAMTADGHDLILAGHTHGGQVCVPGFGALVTNCDLDTARVKGLSTTARRAYHVAARVGRAGNLPLRAGPLRLPAGSTLLTLTPKTVRILRHSRRGSHTMRSKPSGARTQMG